MKERSFTPMKVMPEITECCAYTGKHLIRHADKEEQRASADHIIPYSWNNNKNDDGNFLIASAIANSERGALPLIKYLKGYSK